MADADVPGEPVVNTAEDPASEFGVVVAATDDGAVVSPPLVVVNGVCPPTRAQYPRAPLLPVNKLSIAV
jgi:hypothetical protein